jgi:hypothetical protein
MREAGLYVYEFHSGEQGGDKGVCGDDGETVAGVESETEKEEGTLGLATSETTNGEGGGRNDGSSNTWHRAHFDMGVKEYGFAEISAERVRRELGYLSASDFDVGAV